MKTIHEEENKIFDDWREKLGTDTEVSADGLHYLGNFYYRNSFWGRDPGDEEEQWKSYCKNKRGVVVLTKDLNDTTAWDIREEHGRRNGIEEAVPSIQYSFYRNLRAWIYGLLNIDSDGNMPTFPNVKQAQACFENSPWVRMNLKKVPGGSSLSNIILREYVTKFHAELSEQLKLYKGASIYLDCTRRYGIELLKKIYPDILPFGEGRDEWIYYSLENEFIIINSYHPSYPQLGNSEKYYYRMKEAVAAFIKNHPSFL